MITLIWSFCTVISMFVVSSKAFLTAPVSDYTPRTLFQSSLLNSKITDKTIVTTPSLDDNKNSIKKSIEEDMENDILKSHEKLDYAIDFETETDMHENKANNQLHHLNTGNVFTSDERSNSLDPWSIVWYIGSFGGLVAFFLIVSCSEWCCRRGARQLSVPYGQRDILAVNSLHNHPHLHPHNQDTESPPPPYHLFAPPPYDSINYAEFQDKNFNEKLDIFVITVPVPIHHHIHHLNNNNNNNQVQ